MANDLIPFYRPGQDISGHATAAVTGKKCLQITGNRTSGPGLSNTAEGSNYRVGHPNAAGAAGAGKAILGVAKYDVAIDVVVGVARGGVIPITAGGTIAAGAEVEVAADGSVITKNTGVAIGMCLNGATIGNDAEILMYL